MFNELELFTYILESEMLFISIVLIIDCRWPYLIGQQKTMGMGSCASANHKPELVATLLA